MNSRDKNFTVDRILKELEPNSHGLKDDRADNSIVNCIINDILSEEKYLNLYNSYVDNSQSNTEIKPGLGADIKTETIPKSEPQDNKNFNNIKLKKHSVEIELKKDSYKPDCTTVNFNKPKLKKSDFSNYSSNNKFIHARTLEDMLEGLSNYNEFNNKKSSEVKPYPKIESDTDDLNLDINNLNDINFSSLLNNSELSNTTEYTNTDNLKSDNKTTVFNNKNFDTSTYNENTNGTQNLNDDLFNKEEVVDKTNNSINFSTVLKKDTYQNIISKFNKSRNSKSKKFAENLEIKESTEDNVIKNHGIKANEINDTDYYSYSQPDDTTNSNNLNKESKILPDYFLDEPLSILKNLKSLKENLYFRLSCLLLLSIISLYYSFCFSFPQLPIFEFMIPQQYPLSYIVFNLAFLLMGAIVSYTTVVDGIIALVKFFPDRDSLVSIAVVSCILQNVIVLFSPSIILSNNFNLYSTIAIFILLFNVIGKIFMVKRAILNHKVVFSDNDKVFLDVETNENLFSELTESIEKMAPILCVNKPIKNVKNFIKKSFGIDKFEKLTKYLAPASIIISFIIAIIGLINSNDIGIFLTLFTASVCMMSPLSTLFSIQLAFLQISKKTSKKNGAILNLLDIDDYGLVNCVTVDAIDLFPSSTVKLQGIETFSGQRIDEAIIDAASIVCQSGSILTGVFMDILLNRKELLKPIESVVYEDNMGISAWVSNKRVLIGTSELLVNHGVKVPSKAYEDKYNSENTKVFYISTCGELTAAFIISIETDQTVLDSLYRLEQSNIYAIVKTIDPIVTVDLLSSIFDVNPDMFKIISSNLHNKFNQCKKNKKNIAGNVLTMDNFVSYSSTLVAAKRMRSTIIINIISIVASMGIGTLLIALSAIIGSISQISIGLFLIYQLIFIIFTYIVIYLRS